MHKIVRPGLVLFIITFITAALLATVNMITKSTIEKNAIAAENIAMTNVLPLVSDNKFSEQIIVKDKTFIVEEGVDTPYYYIGFNGENEVGYVMNVITTAYNEPVKILVGIDLEGNVTGVNILEHKETPGLGANAAEYDFISQFLGKHTQIKLTKSAVPKDNEIVAITSATITSQSITNAINESLALYKSIKEGAN